MKRLVVAGWALIFGACVAPQHTLVTETPLYNWHYQDTATVVYTNTDTVALKQIDVTVRCGTGFRYDRIRLLLHTVAPSGATWNDTLSIPTGGNSEFGLYRDLSQPLRSRVQLSDSGLYRFQFVPLMPDDKTEGIAAVGVTIY